MNDDQIFEQAIELKDLSQRREFILTACGDDSDRSKFIARLVDSHFLSANFMSEPAASPPTSDRKANAWLAGEEYVEEIGDFIGPFELVEEIGRGGMAIVYRAKQDEPICREVAVKLIRPGLETKQVLARMDFERQTLAMMNHRNISNVYEAGVSPSGRPYFVMELVNGVAITEFCQREHLTQRQCVALMIDISSGVEHAHRRGIIHRDIKPSNLLVAVEDGKPCPKIIDFGIAKMLTAGISQQETLTAIGQIVGTPQYMSPEQACGGVETVDTRTDIYSLGAVLYELTTGQPPVGADTVVGTLNRVVNEQPKLPTSINRSVSKDLETACMCCLEKDPDARYGSAKALADDLRRLLDGHPIHARPIGAVQRLIKWVHRSPAAASLCVVSIGAIFSLISLWAVFTWQLKGQRDEVRRTATQLSLERAVAIDNFDHAHKAIRKYLDTVRTHTPLGSSHDLIFQRELLETGMEFYEKLLGSNSDDLFSEIDPELKHEIRLEQATLFMEHGKVLLISHDMGGSIDSFKEAVRLMKGANRQRASDSDKANLKLGSLNISLAKTYLQDQQFENAEKAIRDSIIDVGQVDGKGSQASMRNWNLAMAWNRLGNIQTAMSKLNVARSSFQTALKYSEKLPEIYDFQLTRAQSNLSLATSFRRDGETREGIKFASFGLKIIEGVCVRSTPTHTRYQLNRIACLVELAKCHYELEGNAQEEFAFDFLSRAEGLQTGLYDAEPTVEQFAIGLAEIHDLIGAWSTDPVLSEQAKLRSRKILDQVSMRNDSPQQKLIRVRMFLAAGMRDIARSNWEQSIERLQTSLELVDRIGSSYQPKEISDLRRGIHYRLASLNSYIGEHESSCRHYSDYQQLGGLLPDGDKIKYALSLAEVGQHDQAAMLIDESDDRSPEVNLEMVYIPLIKLHRLLDNGQSESKDHQEEVDAVLGEVRSLYDVGTLYDGQQNQLQTFSLCRMIELLEERMGARGIQQEFCTWARAAGLECIKQIALEQGVREARRVVEDDRTLTLHSLTEFEQYVSEIMSNRAD